MSVIKRTTREKPTRSRREAVKADERATAVVRRRTRPVAHVSSTPTLVDQQGPERMTPDVNDDEVRMLAYFLWLGRQGAAGDPLADWLEAERQLRG